MSDLAERLEREKHLREKALEHLEAARACMDQTPDGAASYLIECAIDQVTSELVAAGDRSVVVAMPRPK